MSEPTLPDLIDNLAEAMHEYAQVANRMFDVLTARIDLNEKMTVELRDDTFESLTALSNRIKGAVRQ